MRLLGSVFVAVIVAGCAPSNGPGAEPVNGATANEAGGAMASSIESGASGLTPPGDPSAAPAVTRFAPVEEAKDDEFLPASCFSLPADFVFVDPDCDGFPDTEMRMSVGCQVQRDGLDLVASGTISYVDLTPGVPGFEGATSIEGMDVLATGTAGAMHIVQNMDEATYTEPVGDGTVRYVLAQSGRMRSETQILVEGELVPYGETTEDVGWSFAFTPAADWVPTQGLISGTMEVAGSWQVTMDLVDQPEHRSSTQVGTMTPLQISPDCPTRIVGGSVAASFDGEEGETNLIVSWTGCGERSTQLFLADSM